MKTTQKKNSCQIQSCQELATYKLIYWSCFRFYCRIHRPKKYNTTTNRVEQFSKYGFIYNARQNNFSKTDAAKGSYGPASALNNRCDDCKKNLYVNEQYRTCPCQKKKWPELFAKETSSNHFDENE